MSVAIEVENLVKKYGNNTVINQLSFSVMKGEIYALLGTNGAGKTTTLECIEGIRKYNSGKIVLHGSIGIQTQISSLPSNITTLEAYRLFSKWNKVKESKKLLDNFGITEFRNKQYSTLSAGQKRRLHLVLALINNPDIIFLDEPTAGLDVEGRVSLHNEIRKLREAGKTIIMASHDMAEVESLCDRIAIIKGGKIAFVGTAAELTNTYLDESKICIRTSNPFPDRKLIYSTPCGLEQEYFTTRTTEIGDALLELLTIAKEIDNDVFDVKIEHASLEQRFMQLVGSSKEWR